MTTEEFIPFSADELAAMPDRVMLRDLWRQLGARGLRYDYSRVWEMARDGKIPAIQAFNGTWTVARADAPAVFEAIRLRDRRLKPKKNAA